MNLLWSNWNTKEPKEWGIQSKVHLDMGCGYHPRNPFNAQKLIGIDIISDEILKNQSKFDYLQVTPGQRLPLKDESVDSISGFDFLEHLGRGDGTSKNQFIDFTSEAHRVLRPEGILFLVTPAFPSPAAFQDPTHVNFITVETIKYFIGANAPAKEMGYGFNGSYKLVAQFWMGPFSKIFSHADDFSNNSFLRKIMKLFTITSIRRIISGARKPTHLVWILEKSSLN